MGRGKLTMEPICNERSRMITYQKRKKGLIKKVEEFHILCNVEACVIILGPKFNYRPADIETWPPNRNEMRSIINKYKDKGSDIRVKKTQDLSDYFVARKKKVDDEIAKLRKANMEAKFPKWNNHLNLLSFLQLWELEKALETKLEDAKRKLLRIKGNMESCHAGTTGKSFVTQPSLVPTNYAHALLQKNMELEVLDKQPMSYVKLLEMQLPASYPHEQTVHQMLPFNVSPIDNRLLMPTLNGEDFSQFGGLPNIKIPYSSYKDSPFYDPTASLLENVMLNNPRVYPTSYNGSRVQPMLPYMQVPTMPNAAAQKCIPQYTEFCDMNEFEATKNRDS